MHFDPRQQHACGVRRVGRTSRVEDRSSRPSGSVFASAWRFRYEYDAFCIEPDAGVERQQRSRQCAGDETGCEHSWRTCRGSCRIERTGTRSHDG